MKGNPCPIRAGAAAGTLRFVARGRRNGEDPMPSERRLPLVIRGGGTSLDNMGEKAPLSSWNALQPLRKKEPLIRINQ